MKLSAAIEKAITTGSYCRANPYMCHALRHMDLEAFVPDVHKMIAVFAPNSLLGYPLVCALDDSPKCTFNFDDYPVGREGEFEYTKQFYCWWVFDLKRKGL